jgi:hypothetical protein
MDVACDYGLVFDYSILTDAVTEEFAPWKARLQHCLSYPD